MADSFGLAAAGIRATKLLPKHREKAGTMKQSQAAARRRRANEERRRRQRSIKEEQDGDEIFEEDHRRRTEEVHELENQRRLRSKASERPPVRTQRQPTFSQTTLALYSSEIPENVKRATDLPPFDPFEIREEVIMSAVAERRSQAAATGAQPSDIDQEFLDALPDDLRDEIMQQERQDRRRCEYEDLHSREEEYPPRRRERERRDRELRRGPTSPDYDPSYFSLRVTQDLKGTINQSINHPTMTKNLTSGFSKMMKKDKTQATTTTLQTAKLLHVLQVQLQTTTATS
jgi:hypothetical protein